jgi:hypothetical protein
LPIFQPIIEAIWAEGIAPKAPLNGPSKEAQRHLIDLPIDYASGERIAAGGQGFMEHFRLEADGRFNETQYRLMSHEDADAMRAYYDQNGYGQPTSEGYWAAAPVQQRAYYPGSGWQPFPQQPPPPPQYQRPMPQQQQPVARGLFLPWPNSN